MSRVPIAFEPARNGTSPAAGARRYTDDAANRLTAVNGQAYTWDNNGNLTNDGSKTYLYNQANQLITVTATGLTWSATYNGDGARPKHTEQQETRLVAQGGFLSFTQASVLPTG